MKIPDVVPNLQSFILSVSHRLPKNLNKIIVFGSHARGQATIRSDVDVALVFDGTGPFERMDREAVRDILDDFDDIIKIDLTCTNQTNIDETENKFNVNYWIREEGKLLWAREHTSISLTGT
ncbi:MAG: nucleotidyltransferase domain-containing protein [Clostridiales bacterium]|nr:nucleotidyltransferase domain-containing protein [Clostridiales bacterium]